MKRLGQMEALADLLQEAQDLAFAARLPYPDAKTMEEMQTAVLTTAIWSQILAVKDAVKDYQRILSAVDKGEF